MSQPVKKFEDLRVWQEGMKLSVQIYDQLKNCSYYGLKNQMQRASVSIPSNISEGFERNSNKEFVQYLYIAKSLCGELRTQLYLCKKLGLIPSEPVGKLLEQTRKLSAMLYQLIQTRISNFS